MRKIVFATNNAHKMEEVAAMLGNEYRLVTLRECGITEEIPENEPTIEGNALQKARYVHERTGADCFADDTGLEVDALGGAPGVHSARYATDGHDFEANMRLLLRNMEGKSDRRARFRTVIALILDGEEYVFEGVVEGRITEQPAGDHGFGYDPVFVPEGETETFAEMAPERKNAISHRGRAVRRFADFMRLYDALTEEKPPRACHQAVRPFGNGAYGFSFWAGGIRRRGGKAFVKRIAETVRGIFANFAVLWISNSYRIINLPATSPKPLRSWSARSMPTTGTIR